MAARNAAAALDEADMLLRDAGVEGQIELRLAANVPPLTQQRARGTGARLEGTGRRFHGRLILPVDVRHRQRISAAVRRLIRGTAADGSRFEAINRRRPVPRRRPSAVPW